jgi:hypothetical protein
MSPIQNLLTYLNSQRNTKNTELQTKREKLIKRQRSFDNIKNFKPSFAIVNEEFRKKEIDRLELEISKLDKIIKFFSQETEISTEIFSGIYGNIVSGFERERERERERAIN